MDLKLALRISTDGAGKAQAELVGVAQAEEAVGKSAGSASGALDKFDAALDQATDSGRGLTNILVEIGLKSVAATAQLGAVGAQGSAALKALESQATATQRSLSHALGMSGGRNLAQERAQATALAALQAESATSLAAAESALAQVRAGSVQGLLDEARAAGALGAATSRAAGHAQQFVGAQNDLRNILGGVETAHERHAAQLQQVNALFESGALTVGQYHRAIDVANQQLDAAAKTTNQFSATAKAMFAALAAGTVLGLAKGLYETDRQLQNVNARIAFFSRNAQESAAVQAQLAATAKALNADYLTLADSYAKLIPLEQSGLISRQQTLDLLTGLTNAGKALGASNAQLGQSMFGLSQALASGVVHAEELSQVAEPLPGLLQAMDRAARLPAGGFRAMVNEGKVASDFFAEVLVKALHEFDGAASQTAHNIDALEQRVKTAWQNLAAESDGIITTVAKTGSNIVTTSLEYVTWSLQQMREQAKGANDFLGNGVPDDAQAAARRAAQAQRPQAEAFIGPTIDDKTLKAREKDITDAAKAAEQASDRLARSRVDLLKAQGQYAEALALEAQLYKLSGEQAKQYVADELATIQAKEASQAATKAGTKAIHDQSAALTLLSNLMEKSNPWEKHQGRMKDVEQAIEALAASGKAPSGDDLSRISQALNDQYAKEAEAWGKSDEAMAAHVEAYREQQEAQSTTIASLKAEAEALHYVGVERQVYTNLQKAGVSADSEAGQQIATLTRQISSSEAASRAGAQAAAQWQGAWEQAGRNVHDALTDLFEGLLNGQSKGFDEFITDIQRSVNRLSANSMASAVEGLVLPYLGGLFGARAGTGGTGSSAAPAFSGQSVSGGMGDLAAAAVGAWFNSQSFAQAQAANGAAYQSRDFTAYDPTEGYARAGQAYSGASIDGGSTANLVYGAVELALSALIDPNKNFQGQYTTNKTGLEAQKVVTTITDLLGNFIPWLKLFKYDLALQFKLGSSLWPDRRPNLAASIFAGPLAGFLFGDVVKSGAGYWWNNATGLKNNASYTQNGAPLGALQDGGSAMSKSLLSAQDALGVDLGNFGVEMRNRGDRFWLRGYDQQGEVFSDIGGDKGIRLTPENLAGQIGLLETAILKREDVLKQFDDSMVKAAIRFSENLNDIGSNLNRVQVIRKFEGLATDLGPQLTKDRADYGRRVRFIMDAMGGQNEANELATLKGAYQKQFSSRVQAFNDTLAGLTGTATDAVGAALRDVHTQFLAIRAQNKELAAAAKASKGTLSYTALTADQIAGAEAQAIAETRDDVLSYIRQLTGESQPLADELDNVAEYFANVRDHADELGLSLDWLTEQEAEAISTLKAAWANGVRDTINATAQSVRDAIAGSNGTIARITGDINTGLAEMAGLDNQSDVESAISKISGLIKRRYDLEISAISATVEAARGIQDYLDTLGYSDMSPYTPGERLSLAGSNYGSILLKAQAGDADAASQLQGAFGSYLQLAAANYGTSSTEYKTIFESGKTALDQAASNILTGAEARIANLTTSALALVDTLTTLAQSQITAIQANTAALSANTSAVSGAAQNQVAALDEHGQLLQEIINTPAAPTPSASLVLGKAWAK